MSWKKRFAFAFVMCILVTLPASVLSAAVTDKEVRQAIDKATKFLLNLQNRQTGGWAEAEAHGQDRGVTALAMCTLTYIGVHPNNPQIQKGLDHLIAKPIKSTYALALKVMTLSYVQNKLIGERRDVVRQALLAETAALVQGQRRGGGWRYTIPSNDYDFSCTQLVTLALREASLAGIEIPDATFEQVQNLYYAMQNDNGNFPYRDRGQQGSNAMTYAGVASIYITSDNLLRKFGCPYTDPKARDIEGRNMLVMDRSINWIQANFRVQGGYEGYALERAGMTTGHKYFGKHDWYKEIAEKLVRTQGQHGGWENVVNTCFNTMFLYKGRAPVLFNKLQFKGSWRTHRRDIANLTQYIIGRKEQPFHWQIVNLDAPVAELHDAPVLYISAGSGLELTDAAMSKLRQFTDTGGTIFFEAVHGSDAADRWFRTAAKKIWPEWQLEPLPAKHPLFEDPHSLGEREAAKRRLQGLSDSFRTFVFYSPRDISCAWNLKRWRDDRAAFDLGVNLIAYATDHQPLRAKLEPTRDEKPRFAQPITAGRDKLINMAQIKYDGTWNVAAHYQPFAFLVKHLKDRAGVNLNVAGKPVVLGNDPVDKFTVLYLTGDKSLKMDKKEVDALKSYLDGGGFLFVEAAAGSIGFGRSFRKMAQQMKLDIALLDVGDKMMSGRMGSAVGYNIAQDIRFKRALRVKRLDRPRAELWGIYNEDDKLVGIYSSIDVMFCLTGYDAYDCMGYETDDALAVATNIFFYLTSRGEPEKAKEPAQPAGSKEIEAPKVESKN